MEQSIYLVKGRTRFEFVTMQGNHLIVKDKLVTTDDKGRKSSKTSTQGRPYWITVDFYSDEEIKDVDRYWKATSISKEDGNDFYKDLISLGYKRMRSACAR